MSDEGKISEHDDGGGGGGDASRTARIDADPQAARKVPPRTSIVAYHRRGAEVAILSAGESVVAGRARPAAQLVIPDDSISREHARFAFDGESVVVTDLASTNGTFVHGKKLTPHVGTRVAPGEDIALGTVVIALHPVAGGERPGGLLGHESLVAQLHDEVERSRHFRRQVALLFVAATREGTHVDAFADDVQQQLGRVDRAGFYARGIIEVMLVERNLEAATAWAKKLLARRRDLAIGIAEFPSSAAHADELVDAAHAALRRARSKGGVVLAESEERAPRAARPVGSSAKMAALWSQVERFARASAPVLILGETGSGKEVIARELHARGPHAKGPFIAVNCSALPTHLVESTLFGTVAGAFTGAVDKKGVFEAADGGTVFLDEIGELPLDVQPKLLRVLEERRVSRVGAPDKEIAFDVRVVSATHRSLDDMVRAGTFREDLYHRLNRLDVRVPPLRERTEDIEPLARHFLKNADDAGASDIEPDALEALRSHGWRGNVRELRNVVERAALLADGPSITVDDLPDDIKSGASCAPVTEAGDEPTEYRRRMADLEARLLLDALDKSGQSVAGAATVLNMSTRTLSHRLRLLGIKRKDGRYVR